MGEQIVKQFCPHHLIIRTLFKRNPWPYETAWTDQMTQGDYVNVIALAIAEEINKWDGMSKTIYVGTGRKSMFELAKRTRPDVKPASVKDYKGLARPIDYL